MGMDVYGKNPTRGEGEYFQLNVYTWCDLAEYVTERFPELTSGCKYWFSNDGDELNALDSDALATAFQEAISSGDVRRYFDRRKAIRAGAAVGAGGGTAPSAALDTSWEMEIAEEFQRFLQHCGGFEIC